MCERGDNKIKGQRTSNCNSSNDIINRDDSLEREELQSRRRDSHECTHRPQDCDLGFAQIPQIALSLVFIFSERVYIDTDTYIHIYTDIHVYD